MVDKRARGWPGFIGGDHPTAKAVIQYDKTGKKKLNVFDSMSHAATFSGVEVGNISKNLHGKRLSAGGFVWAWKYPTLQRVAQIELKTGETIKIWFSMLVAAKHFKTTTAKLTKVCEGKAGTAAGFNWCYK